MFYRLLVILFLAVVQASCSDVIVMVNGNQFEGHLDGGPVEYRIVCGSYAISIRKDEIKDIYRDVTTEQRAMLYLESRVVRNIDLDIQNPKSHPAIFDTVVMKSGAVLQGQLVREGNIYGIKTSSYVVPITKEEIASVQICDSNKMDRLFLNDIAVSRAPDVARAPVYSKKFIPSFSTNSRYHAAVAENEDVRGIDNDGDGRVEPVHVNGYTKKDGTYVRGHYRAAPRR
jgi:hypothetical protein